MNTNQTIGKVITNVMRQQRGNKDIYYASLKNLSHTPDAKTGRWSGLQVDKNQSIGLRSVAKLCGSKVAIESAIDVKTNKPIPGQVNVFLLEPLGALPAPLPRKARTPKTAKVGV